MKTKRILSLFMTLALCLSLVPFAAFAAGTPAIRLVDNSGATPVAANVAGAQASSVYFGTYKQSRADGWSDSNKVYNDDPIKWRVLQNANGKLLLLSDRILDAGSIFDTDYLSFYQSSLAWKVSSMRLLLNGNNSDNPFPNDYDDICFLNNAFTDKERSAVAETELEDTTDKVFLLSYDEAFSCAYFPGGAESRVATETDYAAKRVEETKNGSEPKHNQWWMRTISGDDSGLYVALNGDSVTLNFSDGTDDAAIRPAFNLDLSKVLFTSAANGGKPSDTGLSAVSTTDTTDWKLTLSDASRSDFTASFDSASGDKWTISYSGATAGENEYISAMVVNSAGAVTYYGRLGAAQSGDNKTVTVDLAGKYGDGDKLYVFNEQCNGDYMTDYASALVEIEKPAAEPDYEVRFDANVPATASTASTGSMDDQGFAHGEKKALTGNAYTLPGYDFEGWNTKSDGSGTAYADKAEVQGLSEDGSTVTLYAQWSGKPYTIEYWSDDAGSQKHVQTAYFDRPGKLDTYSDSAFSWNSGGKTLHGWSCTGSGSFLKNGDDFWNLCGEPDASGNVADPVIVADWVQNGQIIVTVTKDGTPQKGMADYLKLARGSTVFNAPVAYENGKYVFDPASVSDSGGQVAPLPPGEYDIQFSTFVYPPASAQITYGEEHAVSVVFDYYTVSLAKDPVYADFNSVEIIGGEGNTVIARDGDMLDINTTVAQGYRFENYSAVGVAPIWENGDPTKAYQAITVQGKSDISAHVAPIRYSVTVLADPTVGGTVSGDGIYANGASATVTATAEDGYTFVNWTEIGDNNVETHVSNDASYLFTVESNRTLIANFSEGTGDLKIKNSGDSDSTFTVTLSDPTIHGDYGDMKFKNGVYTGTLSKGNSVTATGLPAGISFSVIEGTEADAANAEILAEGTILANTTAGSLWIQKNVTVDGQHTNSDEADGAYTFHVSGTKGQNIPDVTLSIEHGQTKSCHCGNLIPDTYTITEDTSNLKAGMMVVSQNPQTVKIEGVDLYNPVVFTNNYTTTPTAELSVTKAISGASWPAGAKASFTLSAETANAPMPTQTSVTLTAAGKASFGPITYSQSDAGKTYVYKITETTEGFDGWTASPTSVTATVTVSATGTSVTYSPSDATITNSLTPATVPTITQQPANLTLTYGYTSGNVLTVTATAAAGHSLSYQWYQNTVNSTEGGTKITDATGSSYTVPTGKNAGTTEYYYCVVTATRTDNHKTASTDSAVAKVTVEKKPVAATAAIWSLLTSDSVTITCVDENWDTVTGQEYVLTEKGGAPDWSTAQELNGEGFLTYENLTPATAYTVHSRVKETANVKPADVAGMDFITSLIGLSLDGEPLVDTTITVTPDPEDAAGLQYQWYWYETPADRTEHPIDGADGPSYAVTAADLGRNLYLQITKGGQVLDDFDVGDMMGPVKYASVLDRAPEGKNLTYTGTDQTLATEGAATGGALWYTLGVNGENPPEEDDPGTPEAQRHWTTTVPTGKDIGTYYVWYKVIGDSEHSDLAADCVTAVIRGSSSGGGSSAPASHSVKMSSAAHGKVTSSLANAKAGDKVTLTLTPDAGWQAADVIVKDARGNVIPVTKNPDGTYSFVMPGTAVTVTPVFEESKEPGPDEPDAPGKFDVSDIFIDVSRDAWYHDAVQWAVDKGLMNGVSETLFAPDGTCTRAMVVTMLWRLAGEPASSEPAPFTDVSSDAWYADAVAWAAETGAVNGTGAEAFSPNAPVTREQLAAILYRYVQAQGEGFTGAWAFPLDFSDADQVSDWANEAMHWMTMHGIITGMGDGTLAPKDNATRAQIATMFMRFVEAMGE